MRCSERSNGAGFSSSGVFTVQKGRQLGFVCAIQIDHIHPLAKIHIVLFVRLVTTFSQFAAHLHDWSSIYMPALYEPKDDADEDATGEKHAVPIHRGGVNG
jgi:hypothetical protein